MEHIQRLLYNPYLTSYSNYSPLGVAWRSLGIRGKEWACVIECAQSTAILRMREYVIHITCALATPIHLAI